MDESGDIDKLKKELAASQERCERLLKEYRNFKSRLHGERTDLEQRSDERFIKRLLPLADAFERGLASHRPTLLQRLIGRKESEIAENIRPMYDQLLRGLGISVIHVEPGDPFDGRRHNALKAVESQLPKERVAEVVRAGYEKDGHIIRPCDVIISRGRLRDKKR